MSTDNPFLPRAAIEQDIARLFRHHPPAPALHAWLLETFAQLFFPQQRGLSRNDWQALVTARIASTAALDAPAQYWQAYLYLHQLAGEIADDDWQAPQLRIDYCKQGIDAAAAAPLDAQQDPAVLDQILRLHLNLGFSYRALQPPDTAQAIISTQQGLAVSAAAPLDAQQDPAVLAQILKLHFNLGVSYRALQPPDTAQAIISYQQGRAVFAAVPPDAQQDPAVLAQILKLHFNLGVSYRALQPPDTAQAIISYQQGLATAHEALCQQPQSAAVWATIVTLYDAYLTAFGLQGLGGLVTDQYPAAAFWTWAGGGAVEAGDKAIHQRNWREGYLRSDPAPESLTQGSIELWRAMLDWHSPQRDGRHFAFVPTHKLLDLAESLFALEQQAYAQPLRDLLKRLTPLQARLAQQRSRLREAEAERAACQLHGINPAAPSWWQRWRYAGSLRRWRAAEQHYQARWQAWQTLAEDDTWYQGIERTAQEAAAVWSHNLCQAEQIPTELGRIQRLPALVLGLLALSETATDWDAQPPWRDRARLQALFAQAWWRALLQPTIPVFVEFWLEQSDAPPDAKILARHLDRALTQVENFETLVRDYLDAMLDGKHETDLQAHWQTAQAEARRLAKVFADVALPPIESPRLERLVLLGHSHDTLRDGLETAWARQFPINPDATAEAQLAALEQRVNQVLHGYQYQTSYLGQQVHDWAAALLREQLNHATPDVESLWHSLERARCGLLGLGIDLPFNWEYSLGKLLWEAIHRSVTMFIENKQHAADEPFEMLEIWLAQFAPWLHHPPAVAACQARLPARSALVQAFFDPIQQNLRWLWLDANGLRLDDLPPSCAAQALWFNAQLSGVTDCWMADRVGNWLDPNPDRQYANNVDKDWLAQAEPQDAHWQVVMGSAAVCGVADYLAELAKQRACNHLYLLLPAPLGQLPWEALPPLSQLVSRAVSISHWYQTATATPPDAPPAADWVFAAPTNLPCSQFEAHLVAQAWQTTRDTGEVSLLHALQHLQQPQARIWLSSHGEYYSDAPQHSGLQLTGGKTAGKSDGKTVTVDLPIWLLHATRLQCDCLVLSACNSNVTGAQAAGWLSPLGIGPAFAALGARQVVGTLWSVRDVTALAFAHCLLQVQQAQPDLPLHQQVAQAQVQLREMRDTTLATLQTDWQAAHGAALSGICTAALDWRKSKTRPFSHPMHWAGFVVMGGV